MDIYFYCSYEHSQRGFFPAYMKDDGLIPADGTNGVTLPDAVSEFFSYDRFRILWRDFCGERNRILFPESVYGMFGIRGLEGCIAGRKAVVNFAILADEKEFEKLKVIVLTALGNYQSFSSQLFKWMSLEGDCGYQLDGVLFREWQRRIYGLWEGSVSILEESRGGKLLKRLQQSGGLNRTERDLLHFAVCTDDWKQIAPFMGSKGIWNLKPKEVLTWEQFSEQFLTGEMLLIFQES